MLPRPAHYLILMILAGTGLSRAATLDDIGVNALRAVTNNLNGEGVWVAQPEGSLTLDELTWEINPANVGQNPAVFSYMADGGSANFYPNNLGTNSWHAEDVANIFYGRPAGIATNIAQVATFNADYFVTHFIAQALPPTTNFVIVNQSFIDNQGSVTNQQAVDTIYDNYALAYHILFVCGLGNGGQVYPPATCYNGLGVAAYRSDAYSSVGPTPDNGRCKPDITAPAQFTSFSTPCVAGIAALLWQAGARGDGGTDTNAAIDIRVIKALLLNGAVKPVDWTNGSATPLDARYGAGVVNALNSYEQMTGGKQPVTLANTVSLQAAHPPLTTTNTVTRLTGWNFTTNTSTALTDSIHHYFFTLSNSLASRFTATATLVWARAQNQTNINNLNLWLYDCAQSNLMACSTSAVDNVEHIYLPDLKPGRYDLQVWEAGGISPLNQTEPYALAWEFLPPPVLSLSGTTNRTLTWPLYPAGYQVEVTTNLATGPWSTNGLAPLSLTNGNNRIPLNALNAGQFFRLRKPNE